jgi:hypothetical protein
LHGVGCAFPFLGVGSPAQGVLPVAATLGDGQVGQRHLALEDGHEAMGSLASEGRLLAASQQGRMRGGNRRGVVGV